MKKSAVIIVSVILLAVSALGILGTQLLSGGRNPAAPVMFALLMILGASAETVAFVTFKKRILKIVPLIATALFALWGTYLYFFSEAWANAAVDDLLCDYCSAAVGSIVSVVLLKLFPVKDGNK